MGEGQRLRHRLLHRWREDHSPPGAAWDRLLQGVHPDQRQEVEKKTLLENRQGPNNGLRFCLFKLRFS